MLHGRCPIIYGPIFSRRHGVSLGVNLGDPKIKVCSWNCIYCQFGVGKTSKVVSNFPSRNDVIEELKSALNYHSNINAVTLAGNSEPTEHPKFQDIVGDILELQHASHSWILNCLSNGSNLDDDVICDACNKLDEVWIKLDCATNLLFKRLNRPLSIIGTVEDHLKRLEKLREYSY